MISLTFAIIAVTIVVSVIAFSNRTLFRRLMFNPYDISEFGNNYRFVSYALVHADWIHLLINMMVLFSFGRIVEDYYGLIWGSKGLFYYGLLYLGGVAISTLPAYGKHRHDYSYNAVGASGAVSAVVFASILFDPMNRIYIFLLPVGIPAVLFGTLYLVYSWYMAKKNVDNIGHDVHFWGALFGFVFTLVLKPALFAHFLGEIFH